MVACPLGLNKGTSHANTQHSNSVWKTVVAVLVQQVWYNKCYQLTKPCMLVWWPSNNSMYASM